MARKSPRLPPRKVIAAAMGAAVAVVAFSSFASGEGRPDEGPLAIVTGIAALLAGYLVPPAATDRIVMAPLRPRGRQVTGFLAVS